jgi:hypothetical protein
MPTCPVAPELFDTLVEWSDKVTRARNRKGALRGNSAALVTFCESFFAQFFDNVLHEDVTSFDMVAAGTASKLRRKLKESGDPGGSIPLIAWFQEFCKRQNRVGDLGYTSSITDCIEFCKSYMITLLERIVAWANGLHDYPEVVDKARKSSISFVGALNKVVEKTTT